MLFADDAGLLVESEEELDRMARRFDDACRKRMLKVNVSKNKTYVFERNGR